MISKQKYRHVSALDTDLYVHSTSITNYGYILVRASIINQRTEDLYEIATYKIYNEHLKNWQVVSE